MVQVRRHAVHRLSSYKVFTLFTRPGLVSQVSSLVGILIAGVKLSPLEVGPLRSPEYHPDPRPINPPDWMTYPGYRHLSRARVTMMAPSRDTPVMTTHCPLRPHTGSQAWLSSPSVTSRNAIHKARSLWAVICCRERPGLSALVSTRCPLLCEAGDEI